MLDALKQHIKRSAFQVIKWRQCLIILPFSSLADSSPWIGKKQNWDFVLFGLPCRQLRKLVVSYLNAGARTIARVQRTKLYAQK